MNSIVILHHAGKTRARDAALNAIQSPLLDIGIERATGIVWNITGGSDLTLFEVVFAALIFHRYYYFYHSYQDLGLRNGVFIYCLTEFICLLIFFSSNEIQKMVTLILNPN